MKFDDANLLSPNLEIRFRATVRGGDRQVDTWPRGCRGSANGWLMLVGPSPGRADDSNDRWPGGPGRPIDEIASVGPHASALQFDTNRGRNRRWSMLYEAVFGRTDYAAALTSLVNLDWGHYSDAKTIPEDYLQAGCRVVYDLILLSRPRIVLALTKTTWSILTPFLASHAEAVHQHVSIADLDCLRVRLPGGAADSLVIRAPQHPSRHWFTAEHAARVAAEAAYLRGGEQPDIAARPVASLAPHVVTTPSAWATQIAGRGLSVLRPSLEAIFARHGYTQLSQAADAVRVKGPKPFGVNLAVHFESGELVLCIRRGGEPRLRPIQRDLGGALEGNVLKFRSGDVATCEAQLGRVVEWLRSNG